MASKNTTDASLLSQFESETIILAVLNTVGLALALAIIVPASLQLLAANPGCGYPNAGWKCAFGGYLLATVVVGYVVVYTNSQNKVLAAIYLSMAIAFMAVAMVTIFVLLMGSGDFSSNDSAGNRLERYSSWLRRPLVDEKWDTVKTCFVQKEICKRSFNKTTKTSMEASCCWPPEHCGFKYKNHTHWEVPESGLDSRDPDCFTWSQKPGDVCYECDSCKAGYISSFTNSWTDFGFNCFFIGCLLLLAGCLLF